MKILPLESRHARRTGSHKSNCSDHTKKSFDVYGTDGFMNLNQRRDNERL
jgi:hypothetical protein